MSRFNPGVPVAVPTIVAIPARDEAEHIDRCLDALAAQRGADGGPLDAGTPCRVLVLINNTTDDTAARLERWRDRHDLSVAWRQVILNGEAHAGAARKLAMDWAREELGSTRHGIICTTDADSEVDPAWLVKTWAAIGSGADAVAGVVEFDPNQLATLRLSPLRRLEARFAALQAQIVAHLDPEPHNPWPNHIWAWGASLALTTGAYDAVGGLPPAPLAEDRALVAALKAQDLRVRHALDVRVRTSMRASGRAAGGLADLIHRYADGDDTSPCDAELRPVATLVTRATGRQRLRRLRAARRRSSSACSDLARRLEVHPAAVDRAIAEPRFGAAWSALEAMSPVLSPRRLFPSDLPHEIGLAEAVISDRSRRAGEHRADTSRAASAGLWSAPTPSVG